MLRRKLSIADKKAGCSGGLLIRSTAAKKTLLLKRMAAKEMLRLILSLVAKKHGC